MFFLVSAFLYLTPPAAEEWDPSGEMYKGLNSTWSSLKSSHHRGKGRKS